MSAHPRRGTTVFLFFFQAEDGIRDIGVTGVQTCALQIFMRYAFELARERRGRVSSATKSNGIIHTMPFWDEIFREYSTEHPGIEADQYHIDALAAAFVLDPRHFDVVVASNLFGDILSDLGAAIAGSIGIAPSANLNPEGEFPSMFEPVHGSAPDIAGRGVADRKSTRLNSSHANIS